MRIDRWNLEKAGKWLAVASWVAFFGAKLLTRMEEIARRQAEGAVDWHEMNHHADEEDL